MSGHSKWATIKHDKGVNDAKRGKAFSRIGKAISIAVREGGSDDPEFNPKLRLMMEKAKEINMPKENIKRAIDKGAGRIAGAAYEQVTYEGFGPNRVAFMIECVTDNRNRTNSEIKGIFEKNGGVLGTVGSTNYFFDRKGVLNVSIPAGKNKEEAELELIDAGAQDMQEAGDSTLDLIVDASSTHAVAETLRSQNYTVNEADVAMIPNSFIELTESDYERFERFEETVDDYEDVQKLFHNAKKI